MDDWEILIFNLSSGSEQACTLACHSNIWTFSAMKNVDGHHKGMLGKEMKAGEVERWPSCSNAISQYSSVMGKGGKWSFLSFVCFLVIHPQQETHLWDSRATGIGSKHSDQGDCQESKT